jgi:hypothetical protein
MAKIDPTTDAPRRESTGDDEVDQILAGIERSSEQSLDQNARVLDGHLKASDNIIANIAALRTICDSGELMKAALGAAENPT